MNTRTPVAWSLSLLSALSIAALALISEDLSLRPTLGLFHASSTFLDVAILLFPLSLLLVIKHFWLGALSVIVLTPITIILLGKQNDTWRLFLWRLAAYAFVSAGAWYGSLAIAFHLY